MRKSIALLVMFFTLFVELNVFAYEKTQPVFIKNINATAKQPYIIEGYEITNPTGDCINIINSKYIIIRNNYIHNCGTDKEFQKKTDHYKEGYAVIIGNSSNIIFENNTLENNFRGFIAYNTNKLKAINNYIINTTQYSPLWCERCPNSEFAFNYLSDNGNPEIFWAPGDRAIGIWIKRSDNVSIHHNKVIRSTSDGIAVTGQIYGPSFTVPDTYGKGPRDDYTGYSTNISIYNNLLLDNMEQGVWLVNDRNVKVYNNTIRTGCFTYGSTISTEFNVGNSEFYNNKFLTCNSGPPGGANSFNISFHDNTYYSYDGRTGDFMFFFDNGTLIGRQSIGEIAPYEESHNNKEWNNKWVVINGKLAEEMKAKKDYAEKYKTYEAKGWFKCELPDGSINSQCIEQEKAKGNQGIKRELLFYSSLMENFDEFVIHESKNSLRKLIIFITVFSIVLGIIYIKKIY